MNRFVGLLRAVNVGGTGKLPMTELVRMCTDAGFQDVRTYIASGNVVFSTDLPAAQAKKALEKQLQDYAGKPVGVFIRTPEEMQQILADNPFADREARYTATHFLNEPPPPDALEHATGVNTEEMRLGKREIYVYYGEGMGRSKLRIPAAKSGTGRNMNTVAKLADMASKD
jgi:uncharacterized protein (DUF1697 family)